MNKIEIRQRGGYRNLDKLWEILTKDNWETIPQTKILLYDCDTNKGDEEFGHIFRRTIPSQENIIKKGIENLFPETTIKKALEHKKEFVDYKIIKGTTRGVKYIEEINVINKDEKRNFANWVCENGTAEDFRNFEVVFSIIKDIIKSSNHEA